MRILQEEVLELDYYNTSVYGYIYITLNTITNKYYIGKRKIQTQGKKHENYFGSGKIIKRALKKYKEEDFKKYIIAIAYTENELNKLEIEFIKKYNATKSKDFYNIHVGGKGGYTMQGYTDQEKKQYSDNMSVIIKKKYENIKFKEYVRQKTIEATNTKEVREKKSISMKKLYKIITVERKNNWFNNCKKSWGNQERREQAKNRMDKKYEENPNLKKQLSDRWKGDKNPKNKGLTKEEIQKLSLSRRKLRKQFYMCDADWNVIKHFDGLEEALFYLGLKSHDGLYKAIKNKIKYKNYFWKRTEHGESQETIEITS